MKILKVLFASILSVLCLEAKAQQLIQNGGFSNTTANWITGCTNVEAQYPETTYGGTNSSNTVAEVDDESCFYQNGCVLPGSSYILALNASRRIIAGSTISTNIKIEGLNAANVVVGTPLVDYTFIRANTTFSLTPVTGIPTITVPGSSGIVRLKIAFTDVTPGFATLGMIVDDISLTFQNPPIFNGDTATCITTATTLSITNIASTGVDHNWFIGGGGTPATSTLSNPVVSWSTTGIKVVSCVLSNGTCPVDTITRNIIVSTVATPTVISPVSYCRGQNAIALTATGTNLLWYTTSVGGVASTTAPIPITTTAGSTIYYVSQGIGICESGRVPITVVINPGVSAAFNYSIHYSCIQDTVQFTNLSTGAGNYTWSFGDNNSSSILNPTHIYSRQGVYTIKLLTSDGTCRDSATQTIDLNHPLSASFAPNEDTICQNQTVTFSNTSVTTTRNSIVPSYHWDFGDGSNSNVENPIHTYVRTGIFRVVMHVTDFVPCVDSAVHFIHVDTPSALSLVTTDTIFCAGQSIMLNAAYQPIGFRGLTWDFGDHTIIKGINPVQHAYDSAGLYTIKVSAAYHVCPDTSLTKSILVKPFPKINLGADTFICPNSSAITLSDNINSGQPGASWLWSTGSTTSAINVFEPNTYAATVTINGCSTTDSVTIYKDCYIDIPNSFTPNGDGLNDYFFPRTQLSHAVTIFRMQIFNRWGQIIFETKNIDGRGWDGRFNNEIQPQGAYIYLMDVVFANGIKEHYTGNVTLLR